MKLPKLIKSVISLNVFSLIFVGAMAQASDQIPYYGDDFYQDLQAGISDLELQMKLRDILQGYHIARDGQNDVISKSCSYQDTSCYRQNILRYKEARRFVTEGYYVRQNEQGVDVVLDVYCDMTRPLSKKSSINVEHTWPQSRFSRAYDKSLQKSDLHHLFPTDEGVNRTRGNHPFGEVDTDLETLGCEGPRFGLGTSGAQEIFEPPQNHKGNVARALFYFSIRYELSISKSEEEVLRQWHQEDPVDEDEINRNNKIFELQRNRNPFIDFPNLETKISDF